MRGYKEFLEELSRYNTVGRLRNLRLAVNQVTDALNDRRVVARAENLLELVRQLQPLTTYLAEAQANLPDDHPWSQRATATRQTLLEEVRRFSYNLRPQVRNIWGCCQHWYGWQMRIARSSGLIPT